MSIGLKSPVARAVGLIFVLGAFGYSGYAVWRHFQQGTGSESETVTLVCAKCAAETSMSSKQFAELPNDADSGNWRCPKCNAMAARPTPFRCPTCKRAFLPPPMDAPMVCPLCKAPF